MTYVSTKSYTISIRGAFGAFGAAILRWFEAYADTRVSPRRKQIEALEAKSDAELAGMGLSRDQIAYYVFRDVFYT
ncbi:hypothetical protein PEL8287_01420 [Roseovarius litorisediminis]|uniref:DUF1127 domain-containing protein n=1 Tax=Roseovarius litorisediminis TaxID=1312363 RepID=A0A1Y5S285_9RHOB|nr:hypothetical protein [Roseovarius litorisediminis]SLN30409.1 hypothetical protein PEL8287_01420 [Roseovarius litorisediminis]